MRIAVISMYGTTPVGGLERVVADHVRFLERRHTVRVFSAPSRSLSGRTIVRNSWLHKALIVLFPLVSWIPARLWAGRGGLVVSHGFSSMGLGCDAVIAHGCWAAYSEAVRLPRGLFGLFARSYECCAAHLARRIIGVSDFVVEQWCLHYRVASTKACVVPNGVDATTFSPRSPDERVCAGSRIRVLFVGRVEEAKGLAHLKRLHDELGASGDDVSVVLCAPTPPARSVASDLHRFELRHGLDPVAMAAEYNRADLFLLPSSYEGFELSTIEALACGTPVMLNPVGARPTLERLGCPALFPLSPGESPLAAIRQAAARFRGMKRSAISGWASRSFSASSSLDVLERTLEGLEDR